MSISTNNNYTDSSFYHPVISQKDRENAQKIHQETGFPLNQLFKISSDDLMMIEIQIEGFQIACKIFDEEQILQNLTCIIDNLDKLWNFSIDEVRTIQSLSKLKHEKSQFPSLFFNQMANIKIGIGGHHFAKWLTNYNHLIEAFYQLDIGLEELISSIHEINDNIYFANCMTDEFVILCNHSKRSPLNILSIEPRKFVYFLAKSKYLLNKIKDTTDPMTSFDQLFDLPLEELRKTFPYTNNELRAFTKRKYTQISPKSAIEVRKLSSNICPIDSKIAKSEGIVGGNELPFYPLVLSALKQVERDLLPIENEQTLKKIAKLRNALLSSWDIGVIYYPPEVRNEHHFAKRVEGRKEVASQLIITRLKELAAESSVEPFDVVFHGGWQGHAIMYGISFDPQQKTYTFSLWNTGNGLLHHPKKQFDPSKSEQPIGDFNESPDRYIIRATWSGLRFDQVTDQMFLETLLEEQVTNVVGDPDLTYKKINTHFNKEQDSKNSEDIGFHQAQKHGNCAWKSFWALSADLLDRDHSPALPLRVKLETLKILDGIMREFANKEDSTATDKLLAENVQQKSSRVSKKLLTVK